VSTPDPFGCADCWPASADEAWDARQRLEHEQHLIRESHYAVSLWACPRCAQRFLSVFTETIDWDDGEDPQYWTAMPLTADEARELARQGDSLSEATLNELAPQRRSLQRDYPKDAERPVVHWGRGVFVFEHD
jgi:hypothetical protein